jgi:hypothetical protein
MGIIEQAQKDIERITSDLNGFGIAMTIISPSGITADIVGIHAKHHLGIDTEGNAVNFKKAHIAISEKLLVDQGYPVRRNGQVDLRDHIVKVKDSTGTLCVYAIQTWFPDETVGLIVCHLETYE